MAACLRSAKTFQDCHDEMKKSCAEHEGPGACPMMGGMGGKHHRRGGPKR